MRSGVAYDAMAVEVAVEEFLRQRAHAHAAQESPPQEQQQQNDDAAALQEYLNQHPPDLDAIYEQIQAMQQQ